MRFIRDFIKLLLTKKSQFELDELKRILSTEDEVYLLSFAREIKALNLGKYFYSDCTVDTLILYRSNLTKGIISRILKLK